MAKGYAYKRVSEAMGLACYFCGWNEEDENKLFELLSQSKSRFILSTWHHNAHRANTFIENLWEKNFEVLTKEHFYHVGAKESNRSSVMEALIVNFPIPESLLKPQKEDPNEQLEIASN
jgi:DNA adenine methylase